MKKVMMTVFKIVLILIAVVVVGVVALILFALHKESNYYKYTEAVGEIEQKYTAFGDKEVSCQEYDANDDVIGKYAVWYPSELESSNTQYPVVIFANGTGSTSSTYKPFLTHLSSWGFISVGNDDENTRTGASLEETIKFLIAENEKKDSIFYHKIDLDNIGIAGHSQGGPAVFNMVTNQEHGSMVKALYAASATSSYRYMDADFVKEHPYIYLSVDGEDMIFQITALFVTDIGFDYIAPDPTGDDLTSFFETIARKNWLDFDGVTFSEEDSVLTLSTCCRKYDKANSGNQRLVVMAKLLPEGATEQAFTVKLVRKPEMT